MLCVSVCQSLSCIWLCKPMGGNPQGSSIHRTIQAKIMEWVRIFPRSEPGPPALKADSLPLSHQGSPVYYLHCGKNNLTTVGVISLCRVKDVNFG